MAGNLADVVEHVAVSRIVEYPKPNDKAFRIDLFFESAKGRRAAMGIGRLVNAAPVMESRIFSVLSSNSFVRRIKTWRARSLRLSHDGGGLPKCWRYAIRQQVAAGRLRRAAATA